MTENINKAFWDNRNKLWLMPLRPGKQIPEGAQLFVGKSGGKYYYFPGEQGNQAGIANIQQRQPQQGAQQPQAGVDMNAPQQPQAPQAPQGPTGQQAMQQPQKKKRAVIAPVNQAQVIGDIRMEDVAPDERIKQPWRTGKFPITIPFPIKGTDRVESRVQWMLPNNYFRGLAENKPWKLDEARMSEFNLRLPEPEDPDRMHSHAGAIPEHKINMPHNIDEASMAHRDEIANYDRLFYGKQPQADWMERYKVDVRANVPVNFGGRKYEATVYSSPGMEKPIYFFEDQMGGQLVASPYDKLQKFNKPAEAVKYVQDLFNKYGKVTEAPKEDWNQEEVDPEAEDMEDPNLQDFYQVRRSIDDIEKRVLIAKAMDVIEKVGNQENLFCSYKTGDDELTMTGDNDNYNIKLNGTPVIETDDIEQAMSKYYQEVGKMLNNQVKDKDTALNLFGEKVVGINRKVIPMLNNMGRTQEAKWLEGLDLNLIKYEPQNNFFGIVPVSEEMGQGAAEAGRKPSGPLKYNAKKIGQDLVELKDIDGAMPDDTDYTEIEPATEVLDETYQMRHSPKEQDPIIGKGFDPDELENVADYQDKVKALGDELGVDWNEVDLKQLCMGFKDEQEHKDVVGDAPEAFVKIALAHLKEDPEYYTKIKEALDGKDIEKAFWDAKRHIWMNYLGPGEQLPFGAVLFRSKRGTLYYYYPNRQGPGEGGAENRKPRDVQPGHGAVDDPRVKNGIAGTRDLVPMEERIREIKNPVQAGWSTKRLQQKIGGQQKPEFRVARPGQEQVPRQEEADAIAAHRAVLRAKEKEVAAQRGQEPVVRREPAHVQTPENTPDREAREMRDAVQRQEREDRRQREAAEAQRRADAQRAADLQRLEQQRLEKERKEQEKKIQEEKLKAARAHRVEAMKLEQDAFKNDYPGIIKQLLPDIMFEVPEDKDYFDKIAELPKDKLKAISEENKTKANKLKYLGKIIHDADIAEFIKENKAEELANRLNIYEKNDKYSSVLNHSRSLRDFDANITHFSTEYQMRDLLNHPVKRYLAVQKPQKWERIKNRGVHTGSFQVTFEDGTQGCFKSKRHEPNGPGRGIQFMRDVLVSQIDDLMGFGIVPPTTMRDAEYAEPGHEDLGIGSMQKWVNGQTGGGANRENLNKKDYENILMLDMIIGNHDRHGNNWMADNDKIWAIDNSWSFYTYGNTIYNDMQGNGFKFSDEALDNLRSKRNKLIALIKETVEPEASALAVERIDYIIKYGKFEKDDITLKKD